MEITKSQLKRIIKEELNAVLDESQKLHVHEAARIGPRSYSGQGVQKRRLQKTQGPTPVGPEKIDIGLGGQGTWEAEALYDAFWEQAARETRDAVEKEDYEEYELRSNNKQAMSNVGYAVSHLRSLLRKNSNPSPFEIIDAIDDGWTESYYEFSYAYEREMEEED